MKLKAVKIICTLLIASILSTGIIVLPMQTAFAATDLSTVFDSTDFIKQNEQEILNNLNQIIYTDFSKEAAPADPDFYNTFPMTREDFDYDRIIKVYFDTDLLSENSIDVDKVDTVLNSSEYLYRISMSSQNKIVDFIYFKSLPLQEDLKGKIDSETEMEIVKRAGKWHPTAIGVSEQIPSSDIYRKNVIKFLNNQQTNYQKVHFIQGLSGNIQLVVLYITEDSEIQFQILDGTVNNKTINDKNPDDTLYTFEEIKEMAAQYVPPAYGEYGGLGYVEQTDNSKTMIIIAAACAGAAFIIAAAAVTVICIKKKKAKAAAEISE